MYSRIITGAMILALFYQSAEPALAQTGNLSKARKHLERAIELEAVNDPRAEHEYKSAIRAGRDRFPEAFLKLSQYLESQLRFVEAAEALRKYIARTNGQDHTDELHDLAELEESAKLQQKIVNSERPPLEDLIIFTHIVLRYARPSDALPHAQRAVSLYPLSSASHLLLARLLSFDNKDKVLMHLQKAIELDPNNAEAYSAIGWYYFSSKGDLQLSAEMFQRALTLSNEQEADAWQGLGRVFALQGRKKEAIEALQRYLQVRKVPSQYDEEIKRQIEKLERAP